MTYYRNNNLKNILIAGSIIFLGLTGFFIYQGKLPSERTSMVQNYEIENKKKPMLVVYPENLIQDIGNLKVSEERVAEFRLENNGFLPLTISRIRTSCMCTFGQIVSGDKKSPVVNMEMHNTPSVKQWKLELAPGESAIAQVIYRPSLMPVQGPVERLFLFETNDSNRPKVELIIKAFVES